MANHDSGARGPRPPAPQEAAASDRAADPFDFPRLFAAHFDELARHAYRYVQSIDEAKDIVHDAFFRLWQQREQVDCRTSVRGYLFATVRNLAVDRIRRHRVHERWRHRSRQRTDAGLPAVSDDPEQSLAAQELRLAVANGVAALPPRQREVLLLRWHRQASYEEIARTLGISPKTVGIHVTRALATLRDILGHLRDLPDTGKPHEFDR